MTAELAASYLLCQRLARRSASNFYYSFWLLPRARRQAMCALYAFLRRTDDLGDSTGDLGDSTDEVGGRRAALHRWRTSLRRALAGRFDDPLLPALADAVARFSIPAELLEAVIDGVETDLDVRRYESFADLANYCHQVASMVGLACIHVWGFSGPRALEPARTCGLAFQLTNILRDLKEDAQRGRVYLPQEDLRRFGYPEEDLLRGVRDDRFRALMRFQIQRTEEYYHQSAELATWLEPDGRRVFGAMLATYRSLLEEIKRRDGDVFTRPIRLSPWRKLGIATRGLLPYPPPLPPGSSLGAHMR